MNDVTNKVYSFLEHLMNQMDVNEFLKKKMMNTYRKIPSEIILKSKDDSPSQSG